MVAFKPAIRFQTKLKIAVTGPSGSGKTYSALALAGGMGQKIAVIDTENGSASLYADRFKFDTVSISQPYTIQKYVEAIKSAEQAGYDILIIDSLSHCWIGEGGLLAKKESMDSRGGNSFANWASITKEHEMLKAAILNANIHMICTMRSKQDYVLETNEKGKQVPKKVGMAPQQRDGLEFEFAVLFDLGMDHHAQVSKDRTSLFDGQIFKLTQETGTTLMKWLQEAKPAAAEETPLIQSVSQPAATPGPTSLDDYSQKSRSGVLCNACKTEVVLHKSGAGYLCPNSKLKGDEHLRFFVSELGRYRSQQSS